VKLSEFKAWLEGFTDAMGDAPTPEQWGKIKAKLALVEEGHIWVPGAPIGPAVARSPAVSIPLSYGDPPGSIGSTGVSNTGGVQ
jgi:hypothetical protein